MWYFNIIFNVIKPTRRRKNWIAHRIQRLLQQQLCHHHLQLCPRHQHLLCLRYRLRIRIKSLKSLRKSWSWSPRRQHQSRSCWNHRQHWQRSHQGRKQDRIRSIREEDRWVQGSSQSRESSQEGQESRIQGRKKSWDHPSWGHCYRLLCRWVS